MLIKYKKESFWNNWKACIIIDSHESISWSHRDKTDIKLLSSSLVSQQTCFFSNVFLLNFWLGQQYTIHLINFIPLRNILHGLDESWPTVGSHQQKTVSNAIKQSVAFQPNVQVASCFDSVLLSKKYSCCEAFHPITQWNSLWQKRFFAAPVNVIFEFLCGSNQRVHSHQ